MGNVDRTPSVQSPSTARDQFGLLDTSVFIAQEAGRPLAIERIPTSLAVSFITIGELRWGVLTATDDVTRSRRLATLARAARLRPTVVDESVAAAWALLRRQLKTAGIRMDVNDAWIAASAIAKGWPVLTQDEGFPENIDGLSVIRV